MRINCYLLLLVITFSSIFFCSKLPFDSETSLGSNILNDKDSLLTIFDAKFCEDTLTLSTDSSYSSFVDSSDTTRSGLNKLSSIYIGNWLNEQAFAYFEFDAADIQKWVDTIDSNDNYEFVSFSFNFTNNSLISDPTGNACIEIGYYDTVKKEDTLMLDITKLAEIAHYTYKASETNNHKVNLNSEYIFTTSSVLNISSQKFTHGFIDTIEVGYDTLHIFDTIQDTTIYLKDTVIYDSMTSIASLIKEGQTIEVFHSDSSKIGDTITHYRDTVVTVPETTTVYKINTTIIHIIEGKDTVEMIKYDTVNILTTISQDTIFQVSIKSPKTSLKLQAFDSTKWDSSLCLYARLDSIQSKSMQFIENVSLKLQYLKLSKNDTVAKKFKPLYHDVSVFESDPLSLDTVALSSSGSGRYALLELDLKPIWNSMKDSLGKILYRNIPKANLTISPDTVILHRSAGDNVSINYALFENKIDGIELIDKNNVFTSISTTTEHAALSINDFLIDILYESYTLPDKGYLYIWISPSQFAHIRWKTPDEGFPISYIVSDLD